ncbi:hypothetical protein [Pseudonocardia endophytica]|uniref:Uncharacterized protein n=1 Tax=Pseudonocardia endophytica TaxID=401976 RepID=A0A4R1HGX1_PSEEN|nr:hypothetical protein [Pseudonocardia endophytica]TCK20968.1 hypothetical protein EV378_4937 [Pseudonocardia endophytica]
MGETHQEGPGSTGRRPARPAPTPSAPGSAVLTPPTGLPAVGTPSVPQQRTAPESTTPEPVREAPPAPPAVAVRMCTCGHPEEMHEHYRSGDDCGACGPRTCASFTDRADDVGPLRRAVRRLRG